MAEITNAMPPPGQDIDLDRFPGKTFWGLFEDEQTAETAIGVISALNVPRGRPSEKFANVDPVVRGPALFRRGRSRPARRSSS
jgi:hypothetical protein